MFSILLLRYYRIIHSDEQKNVTFKHRAVLSLFYIVDVTFKRFLLFLIPIYLQEIALFFAKCEADISFLA